MECDKCLERKKYTFRIFNSMDIIDGKKYMQSGNVYIAPILCQRINNRSTVLYEPLFDSNLLTVATL